MLLGHFSSIITTLNALPNKPWLVSTDREGKIRVSNLPTDPMKVDNNLPSCKVSLLPLSSLCNCIAHN